jgi:hypothetical protein
VFLKKVLIAERESFGCLEVFFWVGIAGREGLGKYFFSVFRK